MSNYHVLRMRSKEHEVRVVFHIAVPDETNSASVNLRTALSQYVGGANFESVVPWLSAGDLADIQNGLFYEKTEMVKFNANLTNAEKQTVIDNRYNALAASIPDKIRSQLRFWGMNRDVT